MIDTLTDKWIKYTEVNNSSFEILNSGQVSVVIFKDFLKYPDQLRKFIDELKFTISCLTSDDGKPGKTYHFNPALNNIHARSLLEVISKTFGCDGIGCPFYNINCFNGDMISHYNYPHLDANPIHTNVTIASNIGLTKNLKGGTGFWSYLGKTNDLDMTEFEITHYRQFLKNQKQISDSIVEQVLKNLDTQKNFDIPFKWRQIENEGDWKLEYICPLEYNTLVLYSTLNFHNPYIKPEWYLTEDRVSVASFFDVDPQSLMYDNTNKSSISKLWKSLRLDTIHNIKFD